MKISKLIVKFFLVMSLFASVALAEGQMGGGGFAEDGQMGGGGYTEDDGQMGGGGYTEDGQMGGGGFADSTFIFVKEYLASLFG